jgi:hypothetical protein
MAMRAVIRRFSDYFDVPVVPYPPVDNTALLLTRIERAAAGIVELAGHPDPVKRLPIDAKKAELRYMIEVTRDELKGQVCDWRAAYAADGRPAEEGDAAAADADEEQAFCETVLKLADGIAQ